MTRWPLGTLLLATASCTSHAPAPIDAPVMERISVAPDGSDADRESKHPRISGDGRFVVFESVAHNLVPPDGNDRRDVFLAERIPGAAWRLHLASLTDAGGPIDGGCFDPALSDDGLTVSFETEANGVVAGDSNGIKDVFVRDRRRRRTFLMTRAEDGSPGNAESQAGDISADGRFVAFSTFASNLRSWSDRGGLDENGTVDVYVRDRDPDGNGVYDEGNGRTVLVSATPSGRAGNGSSATPECSPDGRFVAFHSMASDLVEGDTNGLSDVFLCDRDRNGDGVFGDGEALVTLISRGTGGAPADGISRRPHPSADGRHVVFETDAENLGPDDSNGVRDIYVLDRVLGLVTLLSLRPDGSQTRRPSVYPSLSGDGRIVAFVSLDPGLTRPDRNHQHDVFALDRDPDGNGVLDEDRARPWLLSATLGGRPGDAISGNGELSEDGRFMVFASDASQLTGRPDGNGVRDIFVRRIDR